ncbi:UDP-N-acetyl-D-mannosamine dehydrogenase [Rhodobacterales bacterium FZCC0069]|nr:UDP-N-acetyl-D-mannosamine dehydrogenase [Rhodobacterales bacterium FZCC0069]
MKAKKISVIGLGYIGLPTAALLARAGYSVDGIDVSKHTVEKINQGDAHISEPNLDEFVRSAVAAGRLQAFTEPQPSDVYMICVPTPFHEGAGIPQPNIDYVLAAARSIASFLKSGDLLILESTSPVGTTEQIAAVLRDAGVDVDGIHIAYCPERVLPGKIMTELVENDRIVGGLTPVATAVVSKFYRGFVSGEVLETDAKTAEMSKLTENSFRDVNIAFANEISFICDKEGIDVWDLIKLANRHPRVNILQPGTGVGGHCIAVDPWFIVARDEANSRLIRMAREVNNYKPEWVVEKIKVEAAKANARLGKKPKIVCLGLAFKPDIDDLRGSPALEVAKSLMAQGYDVLAVEPNIKTNSILPISELSEAIARADVIALLVKHREFIQPDVRDRLIELGVLDFCGALA